jgi:hypothetical protein
VKIRGTREMEPDSSSETLVTSYKLKLYREDGGRGVLRNVFAYVTTWPHMRYSNVSLHLFGNFNTFPENKGMNLFF